MEISKCVVSQAQVDCPKDNDIDPKLNYWKDRK